jgi:hypothetical protein
LPVACSLNSDYRTVASAVNAAVTVSSPRESTRQCQLAVIAHAIVEHRFHADQLKLERTPPSLMW